MKFLTTFVSRWRKEVAESDKPCTTEHEYLKKRTGQHKHGRSLPKILGHILYLSALQIEFITAKYACLAFLS